MSRIDELEHLINAKNEQGERIYGDMLISIIKENNLMIIDNEVEKIN